MLLKLHLFLLFYPFVLPSIHALTPFASPETYIDAAPPSRDYQLGLLVAPCQHNKEDPQQCCMDTYGQPEYVRIPERPPVPLYRVQTTYTLGGVDGYFDHTTEGSPQELVDEQGRRLDLTFMRRADDEIEVDNACRDVHDPFPYCGCWDVANRSQGLHCMQVAYSHTAWPILCDGDFENDPHCGSFLEVHLPKGSTSEDYDATYRLAERRIVAPAHSGYVTTTVPLYFAATTSAAATTTTAGNSAAVQSTQYLFLLCDYHDTEIRVGSSVLVKHSAPTCCCPVGFRWCPYHDKDEERAHNDSGPLASKEDKALMASCPLMPSEEDWVMCNRTFSPRLNNMTVHFRCPLQEEEHACPYFPECTRQMAPNSTCENYSFIGRVGTVVKTVMSGTTSKVRVTFNGGRSSYLFEKNDVQLEPPRHNYELWWVDRTPQSQVYMVRKKKPFRVTSPRCTYDGTRQRVLPYAILNRQRYAGGQEETTHLIETLYR